jgi:hypothetical protein
MHLLPSFPPPAPEPCGQDPPALGRGNPTRSPKQRSGCKVRAYGLTPQQLYLLRLLGRLRGPLSLPDLADRLEVSTAFTRMLLGAENVEARTKLERRSEVGYPSLLTLGLCSVRRIDLDGMVEVCYSVTEQGRQKLRATEHEIVPPIRPRPKGPKSSDNDAPPPTPAVG